MSFARELFLDNPAMVEAKRPVLQFLRPGKWSAPYILAIVFVGVAYGALLASAITYLPSFDPAIILVVVPVAAAVGVSVTLHGVLAGEREKRSLETLLAAPVSAAQLVAAKACRAVPPVVLLVLLLPVPALVLAVAKSQSGYTVFEGTPSILVFLGTLLILVATAFMTAGLTMLVSAHTKTTANALLGTLAALFIAYAIVPMTLTGMVGGPESIRFLAWHPVPTQLAVLWPGQSDIYKIRGSSLALMPSVHFFIGGVCFFLATKRLKREHEGAKG
ncbi:MAG: ABC transporter permease subunit [Fimbriimonadaceae bacterium]|nr:ABC transporter permease subunit [Fimbriimonadaceae bacterium]QYK55798.1 MAG: ABC transporter permease subunit [Fimbriimonadaceae bacterium]